MILVWEVTLAAWCKSVETADLGGIVPGDTAGPAAHPACVP